MQPLQPFYISGYNEQSGLETDKKPFLLPDQAFALLENAYVWRERVKKRLGNKFLGRLRRIIIAQSGGLINLVASPQTYNLFTLLGISGENPQVQLGNQATITLVIGAQTLTDNTGTGLFTIAPAGNITVATINYSNGNITLAFTAPAAAQPVTITLNYFPGLPVMGIWQRETIEINNEPTMVWDTKYSYIFVGSVGTGGYQLFDSTTWSGTDSDFFWAVNYRGVEPQDLIFFATNFVNNLANAMRYTNGSGWQDFYPRIAGDNAAVPPTAEFFLTQARILIPYYGRLIALNVWESPADGTLIAPNFAGGVNIRNRCRFSQIGPPIATGDPTAGDAWRTDLFGKGGFIDAPTSEAILGAQFFKNTLIVFFERSTWQLRYVGEYGLPFLWERISSDFGSESTFSPVLFDDGVLAVGDKAIITSSGINVKRIDEKIPDLVFTFRNDEEGTFRVHGIRDYQKQIVYWCYPDSLNQETGQVFPNKVLVANYENQTFSIFRDNITTFGYFQPFNAITWDRLDIIWDDTDVFWDDADNQSRFPFIIAGNQQGYIHIYQETTELTTQQSLAITAVDLTTIPIRLTIQNHNIQDEEVIYLSGLAFLNNSNAVIPTNLNDQIYLAKRIDLNTVALFKWNGTNYVNNFSFTPNPLNYNYVGGGQIVIIPKMKIQTKDFNPYAPQGGQFKISYVDFQTDATEDAAMSINLYINSAVNQSANVLVGNKRVETSLPAPYYPLGLESQYAWHRFFATSAGQYLRVEMTYDDVLMNEITTHESNFELNAMCLWMRTGSKNIF